MDYADRGENKVWLACIRVVGAMRFRSSCGAARSLISLIKGFGREPHIVAISGVEDRRSLPPCGRQLYVEMSGSCGPGCPWGS